MIQPNDRDYYGARAASARKMARQASDPAVAAIHSELATRYEVLSTRPDRNQRYETRFLGSLTKPSMQVVLVEAGDLDQQLRVENGNASST